jgi:hypothetical protein
MALTAKEKKKKNRIKIAKKTRSEQQKKGIFRKKS